MTALRVSDFFTRSQSGDVDRTQLSARFSAFLTQQNVDFAKVVLAPNGPAKLVYRGASSTPAGKTYFIRCSLLDDGHNPPDGRLRRRRQDRRLLIGALNFCRTRFRAAAAYRAAALERATIAWERNGSSVGSRG